MSLSKFDTIADYWEDECKKYQKLAVYWEDECKKYQIDAFKLRGLIEEHNSSLICDKEKCGYAPYKRDCPTCPKDWMIDIT